MENWEKRWSCISLSITHRVWGETEAVLLCNTDLAQISMRAKSTTDVSNSIFFSWLRHSYNRIIYSWFMLYMFSFQVFWTQFMPFLFLSLLWYREHLKQCLFEHLKQKRRRKCFFFPELMLVDQRNLSRQFRLGDFVWTLRCSWCLLKISRSDVKKELRIFVSFQNVFIIVLHILNELGYKLSIISNNKVNLFFKTKKTHIYSGIFYWYHVLLREIH